MTVTHSPTIRNQPQPSLPWDARYPATAMLVRATRLELRTKRRNFISIYRIQKQRRHPSFKDIFFRVSGCPVFVLKSFDEFFDGHGCTGFGSMLYRLRHLIAALFRLRIAVFSQYHAKFTLDEFLIASRI